MEEFIQENHDNHLLLFENCQLVRGASRSSICDLVRNNIYLAPNSLCDVLELLRTNSLGEILGIFQSEKATLISYLEFLLNNELVFACGRDEVDLFPKLNMQYFNPYEVTNVVLDIDENSDVRGSLECLLEVPFEHLQLRSYCSHADMPMKLRDLLELLETSFVKTIDILVKYDTVDGLEELREILNTYTRVNFIIVFGSDMEQLIYSDNDHRAIYMVSEELSFSAHCGIIGTEFFAINMQNYTESKNWNSCLNGKVSIDRYGNIKNCPSMSKVYGTIHNNSIKNVLNSQSFKRLWMVSKDQISICKDCEFRYVCTDCRAFLQNPDDEYSKPLKCGYDPYLSKWQEWWSLDENIVGIKHYGLTQFFPPSN